MLRNRGLMRTTEDTDIFGKRRKNNKKINAEQAEDTEDAEGLNKK